MAACRLTQLLAEEKQRLLQLQQGERIRLNQAHGQHTRIQADLKADYERRLKGQAQAQAQRHSDAMVEMYQETEKDVQRRIRDLTQRLDQQEEDHALQIEDQEAQRRELQVGLVAQLTLSSPCL